MTKKHAPQYFICNPNFESHNFWTESLFKRVASTYRGSTTLCFLACLQCLTLRTLWIQNLAYIKQCILQKPRFFLYQTIQSVVRAELAQARVLFLEPRNHCILQFFKPPFKRLGSYESCQSLLSRNLFLVLDSGSLPKWVLPSSLPMGWRILSARKGS